MKKNKKRTSINTKLKLPKLGRKKIDKRQAEVAGVSLWVIGYALGITQGYILWKSNNQ